MDKNSCASDSFITIFINTIKRLIKPGNINIKISKYENYKTYLNFIDYIENHKLNESNNILFIIY